MTDAELDDLVATLDQWISPELGAQLTALAREEGKSREDVARALLQYGREHLIEAVTEWITDPKRGSRN